MKDLFENKSVVIVGPSNTLIGRNKGNYIDSFDTIVRLNKSVPIDKQMINDIGSRTDVLYHCLDDPERSKVNVGNYIKEGIKAVICSYPLLSYTKPNINKFKRMNAGRIPFRTTDGKIYAELEIDLKTRPNTGLMCLVDVLAQDVRRVFLTGFCFYQNFYYKGYTTLREKDYDKVSKSPAHDQNKQMEYWAKLYRDDPRVEIDNILEKIFKEKGLL